MGFSLGTAPPVTVYIRGPIKGHILPYYDYYPTVSEGGGSTQGSGYLWGYKDTENSCLSHEGIHFERLSSRMWERFQVVALGDSTRRGFKGFRVWGLRILG